MKNQNLDPLADNADIESVLMEIEIGDYGNCNVTNRALTSIEANDVDTFWLLMLTKVPREKQMAV